HSIPAPLTHLSTDSSRKRREAETKNSGAGQDLTGATNSISLYPMNISLHVFAFAAIVAIASTVGSARAAEQTAPTQFMALPGGQIAYDDSSGDGPLVICVPGIGDVRQQYRFLAPALKQHGFRVVTLDLRGLGESSTGWDDYSAAAVGGDIVALMDHLGARHAFVAGNSMAAAAAAWAAAERPHQVDGIVLIGPFVRDTPTSFVVPLILKVAVSRPWGPSFWTMYYGSLYKTSPPQDLAEYKERLKSNLKESGRIEAVG